MVIDCMAKIVPPMLQQPKEEHRDQEGQKKLVFDNAVIRYETNIPKQYEWPDHEKASMVRPPPLDVPAINLAGFLSGEPRAAAEASKLIGEACRKHGFFVVVNHGVDSKLINDAHKYTDLFFELPLSERQKVQRKLGEHRGYASSFIGRFSSSLPWKETLSFEFRDDQKESKPIEEYIKSKMGEDFTQLGYEKLCYKFRKFA